MSDGDKAEYRIVRTTPRSVVGIEAKRRVQRELHGLVVKTPVPRGPFAEWMHDIRRGRLRVYGALLRYIDIAVMQGVRKSTLMLIPQVIAAYIDDVCPDDGPNDRRVA